MLKELLQNIRKDFIIEFRSRYALSVSLSFAGVSTLGIGLATAGRPLAPGVHAVLFWLIMFFSAMNGLLHIFTREEEQGTSLFLRITTAPEKVYLSKLIFNILMFLSLQLLITPLYLFFLQVEVRSLLFFLLLVPAGGLALASASTILAAIVAKSGGKGALFTVISFPLVLPLLWVAMTATGQALERPDYFDGRNLLFLLAFSGSLVAVSYLLFPYVWMEE